MFIKLPYSLGNCAEFKVHEEFKVHDLHDFMKVS